ncbi:hypothetical protein GUJ93_ZPchr0007g5855 [Zizania palustris]|uniref:Uncharacterized protein n=1 Tax=Zizania palustris TaxID=103762 RepID=A0A8J5W494_ZIZPA|nr:hypothetical protein GUJ93_ZPchr0007g5855 [Zizania palustris]
MAMGSPIPHALSISRRLPLMRTACSAQVVASLKLHRIAMLHGDLGVQARNAAPIQLFRPPTPCARAGIPMGIFNMANFFQFVPNIGADFKTTWPNVSSFRLHTKLRPNSRGGTGPAARHSTRLVDALSASPFL